ncbi:MAG: sugar nucleotide-binding protein [Candidatus Woesearchaeota archaeon]
MKGIIIGNGYMGNRIADYMHYDISQFRIEDQRTLEAYLDQEKPDVVINAAGKTGRPNIDWCETHKEETMFGNTVVPIILATACAKRGIYMVHIGSGCMYDGYPDGEGFTELDEPNFYGPQFYAKTKILAEKALKEFDCLQLRIRMPIDNHPHDRNLIDKLSKYQKVLDAPNSMTTVPHLLPALKHLIENRKTGVYNATNPGLISASDIMAMYVRIVNPNHRYEVFSVDALDKVTLGKRSNCKLDSSKLMKEFPMPEIHDAVEECIRRYAEYQLL